VDYTSADPAQVVPWFLSSTRECWTVDTIEDSADEGDESFLVTASDASIIGLSIPPPGDTATVTILDDDGEGTFFFSSFFFSFFFSLFFSLIGYSSVVILGWLIN